MSDDKFREYKKYMENRTIADIMADYGEQRDEWETLLIVENGVVKRFQHENGRTFFCEQYEPGDEDLVLNEEMLKVLTGKTIEQQMGYFYVTTSRKLYETSYGDVSDSDITKQAVKLCDYDGIKSLFVKDKILIGAKIETMWGTGNLLPGSPVCTYYASENEGNDTKEREDYTYVIFITDDSQGNI